MKRRSIRRQPPRFEVALSARYRLAGSDTWSEGRVINLSEGGLCLEADEVKVVIGQGIDLVIPTKDKNGVERNRVLRGRIAWYRGGRCGLEFSKNPLPKKKFQPPS